ncbi:MAG: hypothetical protein JWN56_988 [Sphingobacteriales bacterium]|nr:hypothetical protein [Sphingobacteriales bacterium]
MKRPAKRKRKAEEKTFHWHYDRTPITCGYGYHIPPEIDSIEIYFDQKGYSKIGVDFYEHYEKNDWKSHSGSPIKNWKVAATDWLFNHQQSEKLIERKAINGLSNRFCKTEIASFSQSAISKMYICYTNGSFSLPSKVSSGHLKILRSRISKTRPWLKNQLPEQSG